MLFCHFYRFIFDFLKIYFSEWAQDFEIKTKPDKTKVCKECDFKHFCRVSI